MTTERFESIVLVAYVVAMLALLLTATIVY